MVSKRTPAGATVPGPGRNSGHGSGRGSGRLPAEFAGRTRREQVLGAVVGPLVLGVVSGLVLGWAAIAYWLVQVVAILGGVLAGLEHDGARRGALRGLAGGFLYGAAILLVHYATGWTAKISLGSVPPFLIVITTVSGAVLSAAAGAVRARIEGRRSSS